MCIANRSKQGLSHIILCGKPCFLPLVKIILDKSPSSPVDCCSPQCKHWGLHLFSLIPGRKSKRISGGSPKIPMPFWAWGFLLLEISIMQLQYKMKKLPPEKSGGRYFQRNQAMEFSFSVMELFLRATLFLCSRPFRPAWSTSLMATL